MSTNEELPMVKLSKPENVGIHGITDDCKVIGVTRKSQVNLAVLQNDYSPCPFGFSDLKRLVKLVSALERFSNEDDGFEILVPLKKQGPLIIESKATNQLYMIAPRNRPFLGIEPEEKAQ